MRPLIIAGKDLKVYSRDRTGLLFTIAMPLILIVVLGFALSGMVGASLPKIEQFPVAIVDEDGGQLVAEFRSVVTDGPLSELMQPVSMTRAEAEAQILTGSLAGAVVFPPGYSAAIMAGTVAQLEVLADPGSGTQAPIIKALAQSFSDRLLAVQFAVGAAPSHDPRLIPQLVQDVSNRLEALSPKVSEELSRTGSQLSGMQYYAMSMTVMFLGFAGLNGLQSINHEREKQTMSRLLAATSGRLEFIAGKFLGILAVAAAQFLILLLGTHFIYRVSWGTNWPALLVLAMSYAFLISGLATLVSAFSRNPRSAISIWVLVIQISAALGGQMVPLSVLPESMRRIASYMPNNWAMNGFFRLATGAPLSTVMPAILWLLGIGAFCLGLGASRLARD